MLEESEGQELPERWSAPRKTEIVLRLLRGEDLGAVSCEIEVPPQELEDLFLKGGTRGLKHAGRDPAERSARCASATAVPVTGQAEPFGSTVLAAFLQRAARDL